MAYDIAIVVSTFERPGHLERCLASLEAQRGVEGRFEVVVSDDGSRDDTLDRVAAITERVAFPLSFTTHRHDGFRLSRCRNEGVAASTADFLLFTDGDCVLPPGHLLAHLEERRPGAVTAGGCVRLDQAATERVTEDVIRRGDTARLVLPKEFRRLRSKAFRAAVYQWLRVPMRPRLSGIDIGVWRSDFERVNGFDERFVGWGLEDQDLQRRLERIGVTIRSILHRTAAIHLWHEPASSFVRKNLGTANLAYYRRRDWTAFCEDGLVKADDRAATLPLGPRRAHVERRAA